jgi:hypothetical protein
MKGDRSPEAAQEVVRLLGTGNERMQNASIMTFAGHGHMGPLTASDAFDEVLLRHLSGT